MPLDVLFRWNDWNRDHATKHGCTIPEIETVVRQAAHGFPRGKEDDKYLVQGRGVGARMIQVIFVYDDREEGETLDTVYVIHAMPLTTRRRRRRR